MMSMTLFKFLIVILLSFLSYFYTANADDLEQVVAADSDLFVAGVSANEITLVFQDRIDILTVDNEFELFTELEENQRGIISQNGEYIGVLTYGSSVGDYTMISGFEMYNRYGKSLLTIEREYHTTYFISNSGRLISILRDVESPEYGKLFFYRDNGSRSNSVEIPNLRTFDFSPDGETLLANSSSQGLIAFSCPDGDEVWRISKGCQYFAVSEFAQYVATVSADTVSIYEGTELVGEQRMMYPFPRDVAISSNGRYVVTADRWNLYAYETSNAQELWRIGPNKQQATYVSVDINDDGTYILAGVDYDAGGKAPVWERHNLGYIWGFDRSGNQIYEEDVRYKTWHYRTPKVIFGPESKQNAIIQTRRELYKLKLPISSED